MLAQKHDANHAKPGWDVRFLFSLFSEFSPFIRDSDHESLNYTNTEKREERRGTCENSLFQSGILDVSRRESGLKPHAQWSKMGGEDVINSNDSFMPSKWYQIEGLIKRNSNLAKKI